MKLIKTIMLGFLVFTLAYESVPVVATWEAGPREYRIRRGAKVIYREIADEVPMLYEIIKYIVDRKL